MIGPRIIFLADQFFRKLRKRELRGPRIPEGQQPTSVALGFRLLAFRDSRTPEFFFTELAEDLVGEAFTVEASRANRLSPAGIRLSYLT